MRGFRCDNIVSERGTARAATLVVNAVANATLTVTASTAGGAGNSFTVVVVTGAPTLDQALAAAISGTTITVTLGTDGGGVLDDTKNTGTLVAAAIDALAGVACATSGSGAGIVAPVGVQSLSGGHDAWTRAQLAKAANVSDWLIRQLETGGNCEIQEADRIAAALGISRSSLGSAL
jgi:hypothetical protein